MLNPRSALAPLCLVVLAACTGGEDPEATSASTTATPTAADLAARMLDAMGGRDALEAVDSLVLEGSGTRTRLGQIQHAGETDPTARLTDVTETVDLEFGRAAYDYDVALEGFMQHRTEVLTTYQGRKIGWETGPDRPNIAVSVNGLFSWATQNSPEMLLSRNPITVALAAADSASASEAAATQSFDGGESLHASGTLPGGESVDLYYDPETGLLDGFRTLDTETMLGDVEAEYVLGDYRTVGNVTLPHAVTIVKDGRPYSSIEYSAISVNDAEALSIFVIPSDAIEQADAVVAADGAWAPLEWNTVTDGVFHAVGYSHHSMVVEFPSFVAVVEGPYTEAQSLTLARRIESEIGKPIGFVVPTHPHYDHTGGIRGLAAVGATVMVALGHEEELRGIVESPHTNPPDELARRERAGQEVGTIEIFEGMTAIEDGDRRLELYEVETIPHVNPKVLAYVPDARVLFQSDLFFGAPGADAAALHAAVEALGLDVETIVGGHGGVLPFSALAEAAGAQ